MYGVSIIILTIDNYNQVITNNGVSKVILGQMALRVIIRKFIKPEYLRLLELIYFLIIFRTIVDSKAK